MERTLPTTEITGTFILVNLKGDSAEYITTYIIPKVTKYELTLLESLDNMHYEELGTRTQTRDDAYHYVSAAIGFYEETDIISEDIECPVKDLCIKVLNKWSGYKVVISEGVTMSETVNASICGKTIDGIYYINYVVI